MVTEHVGSWHAGQPLTRRAGEAMTGVGVRTVAGTMQKPDTDTKDIDLKILQQRLQAYETGTECSPFLIVVQGGLPGSMYMLDTGLNFLGRGVDNRLQFLDLTISRCHAALDYGGDLVLRVADLNSSNGTYINGIKVSPRVPTVVEHGGFLQFGSNYVFKYMLLSPAEQGYHREVYSRCIHDNLTGLFNRAYVDDQLELLVECLAAEEGGLALAMMDLDHFKKVNDQYGHEAGDAVLRFLGGLLRESPSEGDMMARMGGEEFLAAWASASLPHAAKRVQDWLDQLSAMRFPIPNSPTNETFSVTASIGLIHAKPIPPGSAHRMITMADQLLYQAKAAGRNRVVTAALPRDPKINKVHGITDNNPTISPD